MSWGHCRREEKQARESEEQAKRLREEEARMKETRTEETHLQEEGVGEKRPRTEKNDTEIEAGGEAGALSQSHYKEGHMSNIYLTDLDEEGIVDFVIDHKELYDKTNEHFKDKARKECLWDRFTNSSKMYAKVYVKVCTNSKRNDGMSELNTGQVWIPEISHSVKEGEQVVRFQVPDLRSQCFSCFSTQHLKSFN